MCNFNMRIKLPNFTNDSQSIPLDTQFSTTVFSLPSAPTSQPPVPSLRDQLNTFPSSEVHTLSVPPPPSQPKPVPVLVSISTPTFDKPSSIHSKSGRISRALKGAKDAHTCDCGKRYSRAEHLRRHQQNHESIIFCRFNCGRIFHRLDLLMRHETKHHPSTTLPAEAAPLKCHSKLMDHAVFSSNSITRPSFKKHCKILLNPFDKLNPSIQPSTSANPDIINAPTIPSNCPYKTTQRSHPANPSPSSEVNCPSKPAACPSQSLPPWTYLAESALHPFTLTSNLATSLVNTNFSPQKASFRPTDVDANPSLTTTPPAKSFSRCPDAVQSIQNSLASSFQLSNIPTPVNHDFSFDPSAVSSLLLSLSNPPPASNLSTALPSLSSSSSSISSISPHDSSYSNPLSSSWTSSYQDLLTFSNPHHSDPSQKPCSKSDYPVVIKSLAPPNAPPDNSSYSAKCSMSNQAFPYSTMFECENDNCFFDNLDSLFNYL